MKYATRINSFQIDYNVYWDRIIRAFKSICAYSKMPVSIEYKPYEERVHAFIDSFGTTMTILNEVNADNLGVTLDFCHMLMKKENPAPAIPTSGHSATLSAKAWTPSTAAASRPAAVRLPYAVSVHSSLCRHLNK